MMSPALPRLRFALRLAALLALAGAPQAQAAPVSKLAITSAPQALTAGRCSALVSLQTRDAFGFGAAVSATTPVSLGSSSGTTTFYSDAACAMAITSVTVPSGGSGAGFYFSDVAPGPIALTLSAGALDPSSQSEAITPPPSHLWVTTAPQVLTAGRCSSFVTFQSRDPAGLVTGVVSSTAVTFTSTSSTLSFFSNASCSTPVTSSTLSAGASSVSVYFLDPADGTPDLTASAAGLTSGSQAQLIKPPASALTITTAPQAVGGGRCSGFVTVQSRDADGVTTGVLASTVVTLSSSATTTAFFTNATCTTATSSVTLSAGATSASFYFLDSSGGSPTLTASAPGLGASAQVETILATPSVLWVSSAPVAVIAGRCSGAVTVQSRASSGTVAAVAATTSLGLSSSSPTTTFYSTAACTTAVTSVPLSAGATSASFYFLDTAAGSPSLTAAAGGFSSASQSQRVLLPPTQLAITSAAPVLTAGRCSPAINVQTRDATGVVVAVAASTLVSLSSSSGSTTFYSNASCTTAATGVTLGAGASNVAFYFLDPSPGAPTLSAAATGFATATQGVTLTPPPARLAVTTGLQVVSAGKCSGLVTVELTDANGVASGALSSTTLSLTSSSPTTAYHSNFNCTAPITTASLAAGSTTASFYFLDPGAGSPTLTVSASGLTAATQRAVVIPVPTTLRFASLPQAVGAGTCSAAALIQAIDGLGVPAGVTASTTVTLTAGSPTLTFYSGPTCTTAITTVNLAPGTSLASAWFKDTATGSPVLTAAAAGLGSANQAQSVVGAATHLAFSSAPQSIGNGGCSALTTVSSRNSAGASLPVAANTTVNLTSNGSAVFHLNSTCTSPVSSVLLTTGASSVSFYFTESASGATTLFADATGYSQGAQTQIVLAPASQLVVASGSTRTIAGQCSPSVGFSARDARGVLAPLPGSTVMTLGSSSPTTAFYSNAVCTLAITSVTVPPGGSAGAFYFSDPSPGFPVISVVGGGLTAAAQAQTVLALPSQLAFASAAQTAGAGVCSGATTVVARDPQGNAAPVASATVVNLASGSGTLSFYASSLCTTAVTSVTIAAGASAAGLYFRDSAAGTPAISASSSGLTPGAQTQTVLPPATTFAFTSAPSVMLAGQCSTLVGVSTRDGQGTPAAVATATTVGLTSSSPTLAFYSNAACTAAISSVSLPANSGSFSFYVKDTSAGAPQVSAAAAGFTTGTTPVTVLPGLSQLAATSGVLQVGSGFCSAGVSVATRDAEGNLAAVGSSTDLALSSPSGTLIFYASPACVTPVTTVTIPAGGSAASFYFRDSAAGTPLTTATAAGLSASSQVHRVLPPPTRVVVTTAPVTVNASACSGTVTATAFDARGSVSPVSSSAVLTLGSSAGTTSFFSNPTCATPVSGLTLPVGGTAGTVYFKDTLGGSPQLSVSGGGLATGSQRERVLPSAQALVFASAPVSTVSGACSGALTVATRDAQGNAAVVASATAVGLASSAGTTTFYATAGCLNPAVTSVTVAAGAGTTLLYFKDSTSGAPTLTVSSSGFGSGTQLEEVNPSTPTQLVFASGPQVRPASVCSGQVVIALRDTFNNLTRAGAATAVNVSSSSGTMVFFTDAACTQATTVATVAAAAGSAGFYFTDSTQGSPTITVTSTGLSPASQAQTISAPASAIAFGTASQTVNAGQCSSPVRVEARDAVGNLAAVATSKAVALSSSAMSSAFFSDSACTASVTGVTLPAGSSATNFYFTDSAPGSPTLTAAASGLGSASQSQTVVLGPPTRLAISSAPQTVMSGVCSAAVAIASRDSAGNAANVAVDSTVSLTSTSGTMTFYAAGGCGGAAVTSVTLQGGTSAVSVYFKDSTAGTPTVTATAAGLAPGSQAQTISALGPAALAVSTPAQTVVAGACSAVTTVVSRDGSGNPSPVSASTAVTLSSSSSTTGFYSDSSCATPITQVTLAAMTGAVGFHFRDTVAATVTVTATAMGLSAGAQQELIVSAPAKSLVLSGYSSPRIAGVSGAFVVGARDAFGNVAAGYTGVVTFTSTDARATMPAPFAFTSAQGGSQSFNVALLTAGTHTLTATDNGAPALVASQSAIAVNAASADHALAVAPPAPPFACAEVEVTVAVVDAFANPVAGMHTLTLAVPATTMAKIVSTDLVGGAAGGSSTTGVTAANGTAKVRVTDRVSEAVAVSVSSAGLPQPSVGTSLTFVPGSLDLAHSLFTVGPMDPARLELTGQLTARVSPRDTCDLPVVLSAGTAVNVSGQAPLAVSAASFDAASADKSYTAVVTLTSCPAVMAPLRLGATIGGAPISGPGGAPLERSVNPGCYPASPANTLVAVSGLRGLACWTLAHTAGEVVPASADPARLMVTVTPKDSLAVPLGPGQQVRVSEVGLALLGDPATDKADGTYTIEIGSDHCARGVPLVVEVNGVAVDKGMVVDFACAAVDPKRSKIATVPADGRTTFDQPVALSARVRDACGLPVFDRTATFSVSPPSLLSVLKPSAKTELSGRAGATLVPGEAGLGAATLVVDGVTVGSAPVEVVLPANVSFAVAVRASPRATTRTSTISLEITVTSAVWVPARTAGLGLTFQGLALVPGSPSLRGMALAVRADGLLEVGPFEAAPMGGRGEPIVIRASAVVDPNAPAAVTATAQLFGKAGELPWSNPARDTVEVLVPPTAPGNSGCGCSTGEGGWLIALAGLAWHRRKRRLPRS